MVLIWKWPPPFQSNEKKNFGIFSCSVLLPNSLQYQYWQHWDLNRTKPQLICNRMRCCLYFWSHHRPHDNNFTRYIRYWWQGKKMFNISSTIYSLLELLRFKVLSLLVISWSDIYKLNKTQLKHSLALDLWNTTLISITSVTSKIFTVGLVVALEA